jgi:hypothetical protein
VRAVSEFLFESNGLLAPFPVYEGGSKLSCMGEGLLLIDHECARYAPIWPVEIRGAEFARYDNLKPDRVTPAEPAIQPNEKEGVRAPADRKEGRRQMPRCHSVSTADYVAASGLEE